MVIEGKQIIYVYLARAYADYGTIYETECIETAKIEYPNVEIIPLPNIEKLEYDKQNIKYGKGLFDKEKEHFFPLIDQCDIIICAPIDNEFNKDGSKRKDKGKLSGGVRIEALYALSIGKKVYIIDIYKTTSGSDNDKFREIKGIYDSEELIEQIAILNRKHLLDQFPKIKDLMKTEKRLGLNIHPKMMNFYSNNKKVIGLMENFMRGNRNDIEYVRPIVIHEKYPDLPNPIDYLPWNTSANYDINDLINGKYDINDLVGEMHFRKCIFDKSVKDIKLIDREVQEVVNELKRNNKPIKDFKWRIFDKYVLGVCIVFDIDAPHELEEKVGKVNMFDDSVNWYDEFMEMKIAAEEWFKSQGLRCLSSSTGNGFNVTGEPYWFDERDDNLYDFRENIDNAIANINFLHKDKCKGVRIDTYPITWHVYKKMPFTYHAKWNRITFPIAKGIIDREWLKKMSDLDYFLGENVEKNVDEVIEKSNWDKDIWWQYQERMVI